MLRRLQDLLLQKQDFAFETTLASRTFVGLIKQARLLNYTITLIYYWLDSVELAIERVKVRVSEGGHNIAADVIVRRYYAGLQNFFNLYKNKVDYWMLIDNSKTSAELIAEGRIHEPVQMHNSIKWETVEKLIT